MNFNQYPNVFEERLVLRKLSANDAKLIYDLRSSIEVTKYIDRPLYKDSEEAIFFLNKTIKSINNNEVIVWSIHLKVSLIPIGTICLWNFLEDRKIAEVGYDMLPEFHKKGFMNEALNAIVNFGFNNLKLKSIEAYTNKNNLSSIKLLEKNHFIKQNNRRDDGNIDNLIYTKGI